MIVSLRSQLLHYRVHHDRSRYRSDMELRARPSRLVVEFRDKIFAAAERFHASDLRVFGSAATGSETSASDLDLLVHFSDNASL